MKRVMLVEDEENLHLAIKLNLELVVQFILLAQIIWMGLITLGISH